MGNVVRYSLAATLIAIGMVGSSMLISRFLIRIEHEKQITVKGTAEGSVRSDIGKLTATLRVRDPDRAAAYRTLSGQMRAVLDKVGESAPADLGVSVGSPSFEEVRKMREDGTRTNEIEWYEGRQSVGFASSDVHWIERIVPQLNDLIASGYDIRVSRPSYLVSDLTDVKQELLEKVTADGYRRVQQMAKNSGAKVGVLRAAHQGVFQVTEPNSTETSGYGMYDTSTIQKSVKAVVTLEYAIE